MERVTCCAGPSQSYHRYRTSSPVALPSHVAEVFQGVTSYGGAYDASAYQNWRSSRIVVHHRTVASYITGAGTRRQQKRTSAPNAPRHKGSRACHLDSCCFARVYNISNPLLSRKACRCAWWPRASRARATAQFSCSGVAGRPGWHVTRGKVGC